MPLTLSSSSTYAEITAAYDDNLDYDLTGSLDKAMQFIQACRMLLRRTADEVQKGNERMREEHRKYQQQLDAALDWWRANDTSGNARRTGSVTHLSAANFRG